MSIVTTVLPQQITWAKPKLFYKTDITEYTATSTASGYDADNMINRLELLKWKSGVTSTQYINHDAGYTAGVLTNIDSDDQGDVYNGVWGDGTFIYVACGGDGLRSYSVDGSGNLTYIDTDFQGSADYEKVWGDGTFIYVACGIEGLRSYSVDVSGNLTYIDSDDQGETASGVWGDGDFIYLANGGGGLLSYSVDVSGNLTYIDSDDQGAFARNVWGDGTFIYVANDSQGLLSYSVDVSGNLTYIDTNDPGGQALSVQGDGNFIYTANHTGGMQSYSVDDSGNLTHIDTDDQGDYATDIFCINNFIYLANGSSGGLLNYSVDPNGLLANITNSTETPTTYGVWGDGTFIYVTCVGEGLYSYSDSTAELTATADYAIIHSHNLNTAGATITVQYSTDAFLSDVNDAYTGEAVSVDTTYLKEFTSQTARYWRLKIENCTVVPEIAIMYWGESVELEYCENDFDPNAFNDKANINKSQTGYILGIYNRYKERFFTLSWNDADSDLYDKIKDLVDTVGRQNFVIAWESESHSDDVFLVYIDGDFSNPYTRQAQYRNITLQLKGRVE